MKRLFAYVAVLLATYACGAFIAQDTDPQWWSVDGRAAFVLVNAVVFALVWAFTEEKK